MLNLSNNSRKAVRVKLFGDTLLVHSFELVNSLGLTVNLDHQSTCTKQELVVNIVNLKNTLSFYDFQRSNCKLVNLQVFTNLSLLVGTNNINETWVASVNSENFGSILQGSFNLNPFSFFLKINPNIFVKISKLILTTNNTQSEILIQRVTEGKIVLQINW